jgi:hypothetical protein
MRVIGAAVEAQFRRDRVVLDALANAIGIEPPETLVHATAPADPALDDQRPPLATPTEPTTTPLSKQELCDELVDRITRHDYKSVSALAEHHTQDLIRLGLVREDSQPATVKRRFQDLVRTDVYPRIPEQLLPMHIATGRRIGRIRHPAAEPASAPVTPRPPKNRT